MLDQSLAHVCSSSGDANVSARATTSNSVWRPRSSAARSSGFPRLRTFWKMHGISRRRRGPRSEARPRGRREPPPAVSVVCDGPGLDSTSPQARSRCVAARKRRGEAPCSGGVAWTQLTCINVCPAVCCTVHMGGAVCALRSGDVRASWRWRARVGSGARCPGMLARGVRDRGAGGRGGCVRVHASPRGAGVRGGSRCGHFRCWTTRRCGRCGCAHECDHGSCRVASCVRGAPAIAREIPLALGSDNLPWRARAPRDRRA